MSVRPPSAGLPTVAGPDGGNDDLDGGAGTTGSELVRARTHSTGWPETDNCDGESGMDVAKSCEVLAGVP
jgi:hypothetical protein